LEAENFLIFPPEICGPTNWPLSLSEDRQLIAEEILERQEKASVCLNPANPKISEPNRAGLGGMRRSKRPQLTIFQLYSNQQH